MPDITAAFALLDTCHDAPHLAKLAQSALTYYPDDPNTVLLKLRQLGEAILQNTAQRHRINADGTDKQRDLLALLQDRELVLPDDIADHLHALRQQGNRAAHDYHEDAEDAAACLRHAAAVITWHYHTYYAGEVEAKARVAAAAAAKAISQAERAAARKERRELVRAADAAQAAHTAAQQQAQATAQAEKEGAAAAAKAARQTEKAARRAAERAEKERLAVAKQATAAQKRQSTMEREALLQKVTALRQQGDRYRQEKNYPAAADCYRKSAELGNTAAMIELANLYTDGLGVEQDYAAALRWNRRATKANQPGAFNNLGKAYELGLGVAIDGEKALRYYRRAEKLGDTGAKNNLGNLFRKGEIVPKDPAQAISWYKKAGAPVSHYWVGWYYHHGEGVAKNLKKACEYYRRAAEAGEARAQEALGEIYVRGELDSKEDYENGVFWLEKAAAQGRAQAQYEMALLYKDGRGLPQSIARYLFLMHASAVNGFRPAQEHLRQ